MQLQGILRMRAAACFATVLFTTSVAMAADGRDFAGNYSMKKLYDYGDRVRVALALHVFNYSGADLTNAVVTVRQSKAGPNLLGSFAPVPAWRNGRDIVLSQELTIPLEEYDRWRGRSQPDVFVVYNDDSGNAWQRSAQLSRRPMIPTSPGGAIYARTPNE